jgi:hypothetical protein
VTRLLHVSLLGEDTTVCTVTCHARAGTSSIALLAGTTNPDLWAGATLSRDGYGLLAGWTDARCLLRATVRIEAPPQRVAGGAVEAAAQWTLGPQGRGRALLRIVPRGQHGVRLRLTLSGQPRIAQHALQPTSAAFLQRLAGAAERRSLAS